MSLPHEWSMIFDLVSSYEVCLSPNQYLLQSGPKQNGFIAFDSREQVQLPIWRCCLEGFPLPTLVASSFEDTCLWSLRRTAHNIFMLFILCSGWRQAALDHLKKSLESDPDSDYFLFFANEVIACLFVSVGAGADGWFDVWVVSWRGILLMWPCFAPLIVAFVILRLPRVSVCMHAYAYVKQLVENMISLKSRLLSRTKVVNRFSQVFEWTPDFSQVFEWTPDIRMTKKSTSFWDVVVIRWYWQGLLHGCLK